MMIGNESLDLKLCLMDSAQCFHWKETQRGFAAVVSCRPVEIWKDGDEIHAEGDFAREELRHYLDLDRDYGAVAREYEHIPQAKRAIELYPGLRVLNQPTWEALIAFILSANNNVGRIRTLVHAVSRELGPAFEWKGETIYGFPTPEALAACTEEKLRSMGVGYRAPFLKKTAQLVLDGFPMEALRCGCYAEAHDRLTSLPGVGDKVADCVLLFGCGQTSAFPVDVWVERLLKSWFGIEDLSRKKLMCAARELLGENAGLLQQFLFHAARMGDIEL